MVMPPISQPYSVSPSPSPFAENPTTVDALTMSQLLSLPPLLQPISPHLAALHLARVRLLLSVPANEGSNGQIGEWWCHACGGLREGMGGGAPRNKRRKVGVVAMKSAGSGREEDKSEQQVQTPVGKKRKPAECGCCGASYRRPKPDRSTLITYPSARIAARRRREAEETTTETSRTREANDKSSENDGPRNTATVTSQDADGLPGASKSLPLAPSGSSRPPSFSRVRETEPNTPTYPPPPVRSSSPDSSTGKKTKRKKKSGLAKLLAENKERTAQASAGSWGLG